MGNIFRPSSRIASSWGAYWMGDMFGDKEWFHKMHSRRALSNGILLIIVGSADGLTNAVWKLGRWSVHHPSNHDDELYSLWMSSLAPKAWLLFWLWTEKPKNNYKTLSYHELSLEWIRFLSEEHDFPTQGWNVGKFVARRSHIEPVVDTTVVCWTCYFTTIFVLCWRSHESVDIEISNLEMLFV